MKEDEATGVNGGTKCSAGETEGGLFRPKFGLFGPKFGLFGPSPEVGLL